MPLIDAAGTASGKDQAGKSEELDASGADLAQCIGV